MVAVGREGGSEGACGRVREQVCEVCIFVTEAASSTRWPSVHRIAGRRVGRALTTFPR